MNRMLLDQLTLDAVQAAAIRTSLRHPDTHFDKLDVATLAEHLGRVGVSARIATAGGETSGLTGALLDLAAVALLWVEQIEHDADATRLDDPTKAPAAEIGARYAWAAPVSAAPVPLCAWWAMCTNLATGTRFHPMLGDVPICGRCRDKIERLGGAR